MNDSSPVAMSADDKEKLLAWLRESRERFLSSFAGVNDEQSRWRPGEECWSVLDCVEHVNGTEAVMLRLVKESRRPRPVGAPNRDEVFLRKMVDRSSKVKAPEGGHPRGRFANLEEARKQFERARGATIGFVDNNSKDLRAIEIAHPLLTLGEVSAYEMLIIVAKHAERHALQIAEIRAALADL
jgi:hypothetical protein